MHTYPTACARGVASVLKCLDVQACSGREDKRVPCPMVQLFVGFVLALRYYRECRKLRADQYCAEGCLRHARAEGGELHCEKPAAG